MVKGPAHTQLATAETRLHLMSHWEQDFAEGQYQGRVEQVLFDKAAGEVAMLSGIVINPDDMDRPETELVNMHLFRQGEADDPTYTVCVQDYPDQTGVRGVHTMAFKRAGGIHVLPQGSWPVEPHQYFDLRGLTRATNYTPYHTASSLLVYRNAFGRIVDMATTASAAITPESIHKAARQEKWSQRKQLLSKPLGLLGLSGNTPAEQLPFTRPSENDA